MLRRLDRAARLATLARTAARPVESRLPALGLGAALAAGHDLVYLPEFAGRLRPRFVERAFTPAEAAYAGEAWDPVPHLATRWAAKEAAYKACSQLAAGLGLPAGALACFRDYEVAVPPGGGAPTLRLHGRAAALIEELRADGAEVTVSLSLTHERDYAAAFVVIARLPRAMAGRP